MLTYVLIPFFSFLIFYQLFFSNNFRRENFQNAILMTPTVSTPSTTPTVPNAPPSQTTYSSYGDDTSILAHKNAGNIEVLNGKVTKLEQMVPQVQKLSENVDSLSKQVQAMASANMTPVADNSKNAKPITGL
jgi:hypothetical protein